MDIEQNRLTFTTDLKEGIKNSEIIFLALPTPPDEDGSADLSYVLGVAEKLSTMITNYKVIVNKSTVPVGTAKKVHDVLAKKLDLDLFNVVSNPEFLREGAAVQDFLKPERVVIGSSSGKAKAIMQKLYEPFVRQGNPIILMDEPSAELTKYAANSFLATKISFMNEISNLCERVGANVDQVRIGMGTDSRIGKRFLFPGVGYGGSCFPKDVQALAMTSEKNDYDFKILKSVINVNEKQKLTIANKIKEVYGNDLSGKKIALWGLSFKPNTDDIREAPSLYTIESLLEAGAKLSVTDPEGIPHIKEKFGDKISYYQDHYNVLDGANILAILTEWNLYRTPDYNYIKQKMSDNVIFDGRNIFDLDVMKDNGFTYYSIGRQTIN